MFLGYQFNPGDATHLYRVAALCRLARTRTWNFQYHPNWLVTLAYCSLAFTRRVSERIYRFEHLNPATGWLCIYFAYSQMITFCGTRYLISPVH